MVVALAVVGIIAGVAVPAYQSLRARMNLSGATNTLMSHLKQARHLAVSESRSVAVAIDSGSYTFDPYGSKKRVVDMNSFGGTIALSTTGSLTGGVTFSSRGTVKAGSITLSDGTRCRKLTLNVIGRVYEATPPSPCP